jgi:hypothetical protein
MHFRVTPQNRPAAYRICKALGLGTTVPCPFFACRLHLGTDADRARASGGCLHLRENTEETCTLAVANRGPTTEEGVASIMGLSLGSIYAAEQTAFAKLREYLLPGFEVRARRRKAGGR